MSEWIKRQDAIDAVAKLYRYESDRMTALQEVPTIKLEEVLNSKKSAYQKQLNKANEQAQRAKTLLQYEPDRDDVKDDLIQCLRLQEKCETLVGFIDELQDELGL